MAITMADPPPTASSLDRDTVLAELFWAHHGPLVRTAALLLGNAGTAFDGLLGVIETLPEADGGDGRQGRSPPAQRRPVHRRPRTGGREPRRLVSTNCRFRLTRGGGDS